MLRSGELTVRREHAPSVAALAQWDRLVESTTGTDVTQLSGWSTIRQQVGYRPMYVLAYQDGVVVGGALVLCRRVFGLLDIGYLPYGPVIDSEVPSRDAVIHLLANELTALTRRLHLTFVQPPEGAQDVSDALLARGFRRSNAGIAPSGSYRVDLTRPVEEIRAGFSKRLKSWTNRWESKGVRVRLGDERDLPLMVQLMAHTGARQGFDPPPPEIDEVQARALRSMRWLEGAPGRLHLDSVRFAYEISTRLGSRTARWRYHLHLATQRRVCRVLRSRLTAARRAHRVRRRAAAAASSS